MKRRPGKSSTALSFLNQEPKRISGHVVGELVGMDASGPRVSFPDNPHGPLAARCIVELPPLPDCAPPLPVLLVFEQERADLPVIVGLLRETRVSQLAAAKAPEQARDAIEALGKTREQSAAPMEAQLDGKRVVLTAEDEIVLRCGKASITLRRNGRVVIRGTYVETRAQGVNRVRGGSVQIN